MVELTSKAHSQCPALLYCEAPWILSPSRPIMANQSHSQTATLCRLSTSAPWHFLLVYGPVEHNTMSALLTKCQGSVQNAPGQRQIQNVKEWRWEHGALGLNSSNPCRHLMESDVSPISLTLHPHTVPLNRNRMPSFDPWGGRNFGFGGGRSMCFSTTSIQQDKGDRECRYWNRERHRPRIKLFRKPPGISGAG